MAIMYNQEETNRLDGRAYIYRSLSASELFAFYSPFIRLSFLEGAHFFGDWFAPWWTSFNGARRNGILSLPILAAPQRRAFQEDTTRTKRICRGRRNNHGRPTMDLQERQSCLNLRQNYKWTEDSSFREDTLSQERRRSRLKKRDGLMVPGVAVIINVCVCMCVAFVFYSMS